jgi:hypothetical protein
MCLFARHLEQIPRYKFGKSSLTITFEEQSSSEEDWHCIVPIGPYQDKEYSF